MYSYVRASFSAQLRPALSRQHLGFRATKLRVHVLLYWTWQLPGTSPTNDREGDRMKGDTQHHTEQAAETESGLQGCYRTGERARIRTTTVSICSSTRITQSDHPIPRSTPFYEL